MRRRVPDLKDISGHFLKSLRINVFWSNWYWKKKAILARKNNKKNNILNAFRRNANFQYALLSIKIISLFWRSRSTFFAKFSFHHSGFFCLSDAFIVATKIMLCSAPSAIGKISMDFHWNYDNGASEWTIVKISVNVTKSHLLFYYFV